ncbi:DUF2059 domain-containing protein [Sphingobium sp. H39-3-25]|uniref:DUF2059 domain-containing protein n=1 Tax=Sphingobium arseniciresistens TaxID=3030834 RepID=UPI0023B9B288|nr:DUF2059 domain-containing protein [Sphingobium arseniciresistens]
MLVAALLLAAAPTTQAEALGIRLARSGTLASVLPAVAAKETEELVAAHPELSPTEMTRLRATAADVARKGQDRILQAEGIAFAQKLSLDDLKALVAFYESPAAARMKAASPDVMKTTMDVAGTIDFKSETMAAFCKASGKGC